MPRDPHRRPGRITRRRLVQGLGASALLGTATASYAFGIEPMSLTVTHHRVTTRAPWPAGLTLRIAALADLHACEPWMSTARISGIVARTNALGADMIVLLGDYVTGQNFVTRYVDAADAGGIPASAATISPRPLRRSPRTHPRSCSPTSPTSSRRCRRAWP